MAAVNERGQAPQGRWRVKRVSGLLPPIGVYKEFRGGEGRTLLGPLPVGVFEVIGSSLLNLVYKRLPLRDELRPEPDGTWSGRGLLFGREFCRFRLLPLRERLPAALRRERLPST